MVEKVEKAEKVETRAGLESDTTGLTRLRSQVV